MTNRWSVLLLLAGLAALKPAAAEPPAPRAWDLERAARYLDDRMDLWSAKAKPLRAGSGTTACVTCHTVVPYVLARPALRRAMNAPGPTPQETRLFAETARRVAARTDRQLLYGDRPEGSRGTEAVLDALILACRDAAEDRSTPSPDTREALAVLWETQRPDGAWDWLDFGLEPYESADAGFYGAVLAALAAGAFPPAPAGRDAAAQDGVERLRAWLEQNAEGQSAYNRAWLLLAAGRWPELAPPPRREAWTQALLGRQNEDGGWALGRLGPWRWSKPAPPFAPGGKPDETLLRQSDGYATGLAAYALRQAGLPAAHPALRRARTWLAGHQAECSVDGHAWKCWRAYSLNYDHEHGGAHGEPWRRMFMSDAATAFAALALLTLE